MEVKDKNEGLKNLKKIVINQSKKIEEKNPAEELPARESVEINLQTLLQAGVHFGHQTSRWNPKMAPFIHSVRNGVHIISLPRSLVCWEIARKAVVEIAANGGNILFVGTKKQAQDIVELEAKRCGVHYVNHRWLGGMITNFKTIRKSIDQMKKLETILADENASYAGMKYTKKERLMMERDKEKLESGLGGIKKMYRAPDLIFVIDIKRENLAIAEAKKLDIPIVALADTNCDPNTVEYPIPANDDGARSIAIFTAAVSDAVSEGRAIMKERGLAVNDKAEEVEDIQVKGGDSEDATKKFSKGKRGKKATNNDAEEAK
ncbi:MAG: 30S ribosomal protein S2 [Deltaproteobacteria bacterium]|jgi:small subunit ribosomal protein S2|nr:30S ribosomal protein S2 [Deltaproteobacteria bacterium]